MPAKSWLRSRLVRLRSVLILEQIDSGPGAPTSCARRPPKAEVHSSIPLGRGYTDAKLKHLRGDTAWRHVWGGEQAPKNPRVGPAYAGLDRRNVQARAGAC
jgi:hypothetical protein